MRDRRLFSVFVSLPLLFALVACSSSESAAPGPSPAPPTTSPPTTDPAPLQGAFHFVVGGSEVTSMVYTEALSTQLTGLPAGTEVTITTTIYSPAAMKRGYVARGTFVVDATGTVDTRTAASTGGTYTGVEPDGLFWSGVESDVPEGLGPKRTAAFFEARVAEEVVAKAALDRLFVSADVTVEKVTDDGLVAELFLPKGSSNAVPVVAFGGSEGGITSAEYYAANAASHGHPALALAYFGTKGVPADLTEIPLEYFGKAFAWLDGRPEMRKGRVVVMGGSRGGELALQLASTFPQVVGAIGETPSSYRWASVSDPTKAAWTWEGKPLPFVPSSAAPFTLPPTEKGPGGVDAYVLRGQFEQDLAKAKPEELEAARIRVEDAKGAFLILAGDDDKMWPACDFAARAMKVLGSGHVATYGDESLCSPNAGHFVGAVNLPTATSMWSTFPDGTVFALGGTPAGNAHAGRAGHDKIGAFLDRVTK